MKILHIFGAVVAVHLAVFLIIFAVPGCRSTGKSAAAGESAPPAGGTPMMGSDSASLSPAPGESPISASSTVAYQPDMGVRFSPTRPGSPVAGALKPTQTPDGVPASTYVVVKGDSLWTISKKQGVPMSELLAANKLSANASLKPGQKLMITSKPASASGATTGSVGTSTAGDNSGPVHVVKGGETLSVIARQHGTTYGTLKRLNNLKSDTVRVGQTLVLPDSGAVMPDVAAPKTPTPAPAINRSGGTFKHTVKAGETLEAISRMYKVSQREVGIANNIADPSKLRPGQELVIPGKAGTKPATPATTPANSSPSTTPAPAPALDPFLPAKPEPEAAIKASPDVPVIRIEDTPPAGTTEPPRAP